MTTLDFFDMFRSLVGEMENRNMGFQARQQVYQNLVGAAKTSLAQAPSGPAPASFSATTTQALPPMQQQPQQPQQQPQQQMQMNNTMQTAQSTPSLPHHQRAAAPVAAAPSPAAAGPSDPARLQHLLKEVSTAAYGSANSLRNAFKQFEGGFSGACTAAQLASTFNKMGVNVSEADMTAMMTNFQTNGKINYGGFVRMVAQVGTN